VHVLLAAGENRRVLAHIKELTETYREAKQMQWQEILLQQYLLLQMENEALSMQKADLLYSLGRYKDAAQLYHKTADSGAGKRRERALRMDEYAGVQAGNEQAGANRRGQNRRLLPAD
jgi:hypothetical protein